MTAIGNLRMVTRQWVEDQIYNALGRLLLRSALTYVSTNDQSREENGVVKGPLTDRYSGWKSSDPNVKESETDGLRMEFPGVAVVPIKGEPCLVLGAGPNRLIFPLSSARYRPKNLKHGEAILYNLAAAAKQATAKIDQDGNVTILAPASASVTVKSNNGNASATLSSTNEITVTNATGAKLVISPLGRVTLLSAGNAQLALNEAVDTTLATKLFTATHYGGNVSAAPPTAAPGPALRGGPVVATGSDAAFLVSMTVLAPGNLAGILCTITFGTPYDSPPQFSIAAASGPVLILFPPGISVGMGAVRGQASATQLVITTDFPIQTGPLQLSVLIKQ